MGTGGRTARKPAAISRAALERSRGRSCCSRRRAVLRVHHAATRLIRPTFFVVGPDRGRDNRHGQARAALGNSTPFAQILILCPSQGQE